MARPLKNDKPPVKLLTEERLPTPTPEQVRAARLAAGLSQEGAAKLVSRGSGKVYRTWQSYEAPKESASYREIPVASWEVFLLHTGQHPKLQLSLKQE